MTYLVTGAAGHLGHAIIRALAEKGEDIRALVLPGEKNIETIAKYAQVYTGDVRQPDTLIPFFEGTMPRTVIHCAGIVSIAYKYDQTVWDVNAGGTKNVLDLCKKYAVQKVIYVSSVHAIPELPAGHTITEIQNFDPNAVHGLYAKTKAAATKAALEAAAQGLPVSVVHPSGICGPYDLGRGHLTQLIVDYCRHRLTAAVRGGYDFVDVRDVADGILRCCEKGKNGECYILSGAYCTVQELLDLCSEITGKKPVKTILPLWFAKLTAPLAELYYKLQKQPPLYTPYSLYTLESGTSFSHEKATQALGYHPRPLRQTVADTCKWLSAEGRI